MREASRSLSPYLNRSSTPLYEDVIYCEGTVNNVQVEVAMQHKRLLHGQHLRLCKQHNHTGGRNPHRGLPERLTKTFNDYARKISF